MLNTCSVILHNYLLNEDIVHFYNYMLEPD